MISGIYKIENKLNGKIYIGKSVNILERFNAHKRNAFNTKSPEYDKVLYKAFRKYGIENFDFEIIEEYIDKDFLNAREIYWIMYYNSQILGYNETPGGDGVINVQEENHPNHKLTIEDIKNIRIRWAACKESSAQIYEDYKNIISRGCLKKICKWITWPNIAVELNTPTAREYHAHKDLSNAGENNPRCLLSDNQISDIKFRYSMGESIKDIYEDYKYTGITLGSFRNAAYGYNRKGKIYESKRSNENLTNYETYSM